MDQTRGRGSQRTRGRRLGSRGPRGQCGSRARPAPKSKLSSAKPTYIDKSLAGGEPTVEMHPTEPCSTGRTRAHRDAPRRRPLQELRATVPKLGYDVIGNDYEGFEAEIFFARERKSQGVVSMRERPCRGLVTVSVLYDPVDTDEGRDMLDKTRKRLIDTARARPPLGPHAAPRRSPDP